MVSRRCLLRTSILLALFAVSPVAFNAGAQERTASRPSLSILLGPASSDRGTVGTGLAAGAWVDYHLKPFLFAEGGLGYFGYTGLGGFPVVAYVLPELGIRAGTPLGSAFPFVGVGTGLAATTSGGSGTEFTLHGLVGLRLWLSARVGVRAECRLRWIDPGSENIPIEVTGGLSFRL